MAETWELKGSYFESCNCEVACPCVFLSPPTTGECNVLIAWHVEQGRAGPVRLDGLNAALAIFSPGHMMKGSWQVALYLDERAKPDQRDALTRIFGGQSGGVPATLAPLIGKLLGVRSVPMQYEAQEKKRSLHIPKLAEMQIEAIEGQDGKDVTLENVPLTAVPGQRAVVAKSMRLSLHDHGLEWEFSEKNGFYSPFTYAGP